MNSNPPVGAGVPDKGPWPAAWVIWLNQVAACLPWKRAFNYVFTYDFGAVPANTTVASTGQTITGVRPTVGAVIGDAVQVTAMTQTSGIVYTAAVTANDTVTIYANNITVGAINPPSTAFRIIVLQN